MQLEIKEKTITGRIYFEGNVRKGFTFDVIELQTSGLVKVGTWEDGKDFEFQRPPQVINLMNDIDAGSLVNKTFKVLISVAVGFPVIGELQIAKENLHFRPNPMPASWRALTRLQGTTSTRATEWI